MNGRLSDRVRSVADRARLRVIRSVLACSVVVCVAVAPWWPIVRRVRTVDRLRHDSSDPEQPVDTAHGC